MRVKVGKTAVEEMLAEQEHQPDLAEKLATGKTTVKQEKRRAKALLEYHRAKIRDSRYLNSQPLPPGKYRILYADPPWPPYSGIQHPNPSPPCPTLPQAG